MTHQAPSRPTPRAYSHIALQYAEGVVDGTILACKWTRLACKRSLNDWDNENKEAFPYYYSEEAVTHVCFFIENLCHQKGPLGGQFITLEPWQCWVLSQTFGWKHAAGHLQDKRRFRGSYIEVPRSNGKSAASSGLSLYMLAADKEPGPEVYSAATTRDQAKIVFVEAQKMARTPASRQLMNQLGVRVQANSITCSRTNGVFKALSAEGSTLDGLNIHFGCVDELHAHKTRTVWDVLDTAMGKRSQSLLWVITTAGSNRSGICYEQRTYLTKILQGVVKDETLFGCIWTIDDEDDWQQESSWIKANPNWNISVVPEHIIRKCKQAQVILAEQNNFLTKHLNQWVSADIAWMNMIRWDKCKDVSLKIENFRGRLCWIGLDLASKEDIAAKVYLFPEVRDDVVHYTVFGKYYLPRAAIDSGRNSQYSGWERAGYLKVTEGNATSYEEIEADIRDDMDMFDVQEIGFDSWQAASTAQRLMADGASMVEVRNGARSFSEPMKEIGALVSTGCLHHNDDVMTWMVSNVVAHTDEKENIFPKKERPENKIDAVVALIMGLARAMKFDHRGTWTTQVYY